MSILARARHRLHRGWILAKYYRYYPELGAKIRTILEHDDTALGLEDDGGEEERALPGFAKYRRSGYYRTMLARYLYAIRHIRGKRVLEVGSGLGWGAYLIAGYAASLHCVDRDEEAIDFARKTWPESGIRHERCAVEDLSRLEGPFDVVLAFELIEHLEVPVGRLFTQQVARLLNPGGVLILSSYFPNDEQTARESERRNVHHPHVYTKSEMHELLSACGLAAPRFELDLLMVTRKLA